MANQRQKKLARLLVTNATADKPMNAGELVEMSGYSPVTATAHAKDTIQAKGVQEELKELGFTIENAKRIVGHILNSPIVFEMVTPENQLRAAQEVFKVTGSYPKENQGNQVNIINIQFDASFSSPTENSQE